MSGDKLYLKRNLKRLLRLLELDAPGVIFCSDLALLVRKALTLYPVEMGVSLGRLLGEACRVFNGVCTNCCKKVEDPYPHLCEDCQREEDRIADEDEAKGNTSPNFEDN